MPFFLEFIIPMSTMMAVLLTFLRMSSDREIIALKAGGFCIYRLLPPVVLFCLMGTLLTGFMAIYGLPWGKQSFKRTLFEVSAQHFDIGLKERTFNDSFEGVMLYVSKVDIINKALIDVFIEDQRTPNVVSTVIAPKGRLFSDPEKLTGQLTLYNGTINNVHLENRSVHSISFDTYTRVCPVQSVVSMADLRQPLSRSVIRPCRSDFWECIRTVFQQDDQQYRSSFVGSLFATMAVREQHTPTSSGS